MVDAGMKRAEGTRVTFADRGFGLFILIAGAANVIAARSTAFVLPAFVLLIIGAAFFERTSLRDLVKLAPASLPIAAILGFAAVSAGWSADASATLSHVLIVVLIFLQWHVVSYWISVQPSRRIDHLSRWFSLAVLLGLVVLMFEVYAHQFLRRMLIENFDIFTPPTLHKHYKVTAEGDVSISGFELNRSIAALNMLVWPAALCAASHWSGRTRTLIVAALVGGAIFASIGSNHETSKLAVIAGVAVFAVAQLWRRAAFVVVAAGWAALVLGMVPMAYVAYDRLGLHTAPWLQHSARERIIIWGDVATRVAEAPVLGAGVRSAYVLSARSKETATEAPAEERIRTIARHAHNIYLQTWFELGFVGAALLLVAGFAVLWSLKGFPHLTQPFALATFAVFMTEIASTWEIWQRWYATLFALTACYLYLGIRNAQNRTANAPPPNRTQGD